MKEAIHPKYYQATVTCNCGNTFTVGSTKKDIHVEICAKCHPFYTGQQKAAADVLKRSTESTISISKLTWEGTAEKFAVPFEIDPFPAGEGERSAAWSAADTVREPDTVREWKHERILDRPSNGFSQITAVVIRGVD